MISGKTFITAVFIIAFCSIKISYASEPLLKILYPKDKQALVSIDVANITGRFDSTQIDQIEILRHYQTNKYIETATKEQKENFARQLQEMFPANFILEKVLLTTAMLREGDKLSEYHFDRNEEVDLKKFWVSTSFKKILGEVYNKKVISSEVTLIGLFKKILNVNTNDYKQKYKNIFSFPVSLNPGMNIFYIRGINKDKKPIYTDSVKFFYKTKLISENSVPKFNKSEFHTVKNESLCLPCHSFNTSSNKETEKSILKTECSSCHSTLIHQKSVHPPAADWGCITCHDPSSFPKYMLYKDKEYNSSFCYGCHTSMEEDIESKSNIHGIVEECLTCHDSHGSENENLLTMQVNKICGSCHEDMINSSHPVVNHPISGVSDPLHKDKSFSCVSCHNPHASDNQYMLIASKFSLCVKCHQK